MFCSRVATRPRAKSSERQLCSAARPVRGSRPVSLALIQSRSRESIRSVYMALSAANTRWYSPWWARVCSTRIFRAVLRSKFRATGRGDRRRYDAGRKVTLEPYMLLSTGAYLSARPRSQHRQTCDAEHSRDMMSPDTMQGTQPLLVLSIRACFCTAEGR